MKTEIKVLRILYALLFIVFLIIMYEYTNTKKDDNASTLSYEILSVNEQYDATTKKDIVLYEIKVPSDSSDLSGIKTELVENYKKTYSISNIEDKVKQFTITFYHDGKEIKKMEAMN